jgi:diadenylate cyclase
MPTTIDQLLPGYEPWQLAIELAVIWVCVYVIFRFLQGTRGAGVIKGFALVLVVGTVTIRVLAQASDAFTRLNFIYDRFLGLAAILLIVVFQPELRQAMSRLGHVWSFRSSKSSVRCVIDAVSAAVSFLSKSQFGALIAIERNSRLGGLIETGVALDALVDARLLESIFWPNSPLHDLGVVIRGDRILAASVQFPLAEEGVVGVEYGSRHRAAVGLSMESDCIVVIVSEETGAISIAEHGRLTSDIPRDEFREILGTRLRAPAVEEPTPEPVIAAGAETSEPGATDPDEKQAA